jgi:chemotaxis protein CheD
MSAHSAPQVRSARRRYGPIGIVHTLHPGDVACADAGDRLETLLGSCVAIVLTDPRRTVGVMCHIVHSGSANGVAQKTGAHAEVAFKTMYALLLARGITPAFCEAYVYGGGNMFPELVRTTAHVGDSNARWALDALADAGIRVLSCDVGGSSYRRLSWTVGPDAPQVTAVQV